MPFLSSFMASSYDERSPLATYRRRRLRSKYGVEGAFHAVVDGGRQRHARICRRGDYVVNTISDGVTADDEGGLASSISIASTPPHYDIDTSSPRLDIPTLRLCSPIRRVLISV